MNRGAFIRIIIAVFAILWVHSANAETLRIASWNIEHLAAETGRGCQPRSEADFQRVRAVIAQVNADIWLLQEIEGEDALARIFDRSVGRKAQARREFEKLYADAPGFEGLAYRLGLR